MAQRVLAPPGGTPGTPGGPGPASAPGAPAGYGAGRGAGRNGAPAGYGGQSAQPGNTPYSRWSRGGSGTMRIPGGSAAAGAHAGNSAQPAYARHGRHGAVRPQQGWASPSETCDMGFAGSAGAYVSPLKRFAGIVICVLIAVLIEVFGFNLAFFTSMTYPQVGTYLVNGVSAGTEGALTLDASANYFEITGLDDTVRSIHFTPQLNDPAAAAKATDSKLQVVMYLQDEGNANYYQLPAVSVDPKDAASTYISLDPAGDCHSIYVSITNLADVGSVTVTGIGLNQQVPLDIDPLRFAYILAVLLALNAVRPQSVLFSRVFDGRITRQGWMVIALVAVQCVVIFILVMSIRTSCPSRTPPARRTSSSTRRLAQALLQGHFYLDDVPSAALQAMDNPYDTAARDSAGVPYLWDHAYYQGKYYVYFGVLPCLVFYVPWLLLTGTGFPRGSASPSATARMWRALRTCSRASRAGGSLARRSACCSCSTS